MATVLIAGMDSSMRTVLAYAFSESYAIFEASDEQSCLRMVARYNPALIIIDDFISIEKSAKLIIEIRRKNKTVRVIALSSFFLYKDEQQTIMEAGADVCLKKPVSLKDLKKIIDKLLSK